MEVRRWCVILCVPSLISISQISTFKGSRKGTNFPRWIQRTFMPASSIFSFLYFLNLVQFRMKKSLCIFGFITKKQILYLDLLQINAILYLDLLQKYYLCSINIVVMFKRNDIDWLEKWKMRCEFW